MKVYAFGEPDAPAIVLLPGTCCDWKGNFETVIPLLKERYRVLCVSYDGFDRNEATEFPTMLEETEKIEDYIKRNCGGHIRAAYGCSLGGSFVGLLAARQKIRLDYGILGSSDLDQASPLAAGLQTNLLMPLEKRVQTWLDTPAGHLNLPLASEDHLKAAVNGSCLANFINTVQLEASGAQIASSALPNEFKGLPTEVTIRDVVSTYIYTNTLVVLEMTRPALKQYIERSAAYFDHDENGSVCISGEFLRPKVQHYNYDFFSGIDYTIDVRKPIFYMLAQNSWPILSLEFAGANLEDIFISVVDEAEAEEASAKSGKKQA